MPDERALVSNSAMVYLVLAGTVLVLGGVAVLGVRFARFLAPRQRRTLYLLVLLAATGVGVQLAHGLWIGIWAERHHHHHESNGSRG